MKKFVSLFVVAIVTVVFFSSWQQEEEKEFILIFRNVYNPDYKPSPEQMNAGILQWKNWIGNVASKGKFVSTNRLGFQGKVINAKTIAPGPYTSNKESVGGYMLIKANSIEEASNFAKDCPILKMGGSVEIRDILKMKK